MRAFVEVAATMGKAGQMAGLRHVVKRRVHKERAQPEKRAKLGLLEKKSDYKERAKAWHRHENIMQKLQRQAALRNPDEFNFKMTNHRTDRSTKKVHDDKKVLSTEQVQLADMSGAKYVLHRKQVDDKRVDRMKENLHMLSAKKKNNHVLFVDSDDELPSSKEQVARMLDTHPDLLDRQFNRPTTKALAERDAPEEPETVEEEYREVINRKGRSKELGRVLEHLALREMHRMKGRKMKVDHTPGTDKNAIPVVKFARERKK